MSVCVSNRAGHLRMAARAGRSQAAQRQGFKENDGMGELGRAGRHKSHLRFTEFRLKDGAAETEGRRKESR